MHRAGFHRLMMLGALCGALGGCELHSDSASTAEAPPEPPVPPSAVMAADDLPSGVTREEVERGRELFLPCAVCHGLDGRGNQLGPSLRDAEWIHISGSLEEIAQVIRDGIPSPEEYPVPMVPMGGGEFDAVELRAVASYVYAISHSAAPAQ